MTDDLITRARHEAAEDRRIAALALQRHTKDALLQRAQVTDELVAEIESLRADLRLERTDAQVCEAVDDDLEAARTENERLKDNIRIGLAYGDEFRTARAAAARAELREAAGMRPPRGEHS